ncbi:MAG: hypothetical protein KKC03_13145, partial [Bacteroidetes bacterium]|nr:hypothetical protein [Bacteroidota bacterium]
SLGTGTPGNLGTPQIDDVFIKGRLEVDGNLYADGKIYASAIERVTGGALNITLGSAVGDDFIIDTTGFVYKGNTDRVGIGTATPGVLLDLNDTTAASVNGQDVLRLRGIISSVTVGSGAVISFTNPLGVELGNIRSYLEDGSSAGLHFGTFDNSTQQESRMVITSTGNVGIGTTSPTSLLTVAGSISTQAPATKTAAYSMIATDSSLIFNGVASIILTLQAASSYTGRILYVKTIAAFTVDSASANVAPLGSATAGTAILAATAGKWAMLQSDGTNWVIMAGN